MGDRSSPSGRRNRTIAQWSAAVFAAVIALSMSGCAYRAIRTRHLSENPMDQAIFGGDDYAIPHESRTGLLKRYPVGSPVGDARAYLERVGAKCTSAPVGSRRIDCQYSQFVRVDEKTPFGDTPLRRREHAFRIRLLSNNGTLKDTEVCVTTTIVFFGRPKLTKQSRETAYPDCAKEKK